MNEIIIKAVSVCHNSPKFMEAMIRSLYNKNSFDSIDFQLTIYDNCSERDTSNLSKLSKVYGFEFKQSGYNLYSGINSHGMILDNFVKDNPDCNYILTLDTDIVFIENNTIKKMVEVLEKDKMAYGTGPYYSWDGINKMPIPIERPELCDVYICRLHPCCALFRNDETFQVVVDLIGFEEYKRLNLSKELFEKALKINNIPMYQNPDMYQIEYIDTAQMIKRVMETHKKYHLRTEAVIQHFFCVTYFDHEENVKKYHEEKVNEIINLYTEGSEQV